jgi:hypothetical protein
VRHWSTPSIVVVLAMVLSVAWVAMCVAFGWPIFTIYVGAVVIGGLVGGAIAVAWQ